MRQYDPQQGRILIDDVDIREGDLHVVRKRMALVPQDVVILSGSVSENIAFGSPQAGVSDIKEAAKAAQASSFIEDLPLGL